MTDPTVHDNQSESRFEITIDGHTGFLAYHVDSDGRLVLDHTEVPEELGGQGVGGKLVRAAVDRAESQGEVLVPVCPFAKSWIDKHPDEAARVTVG